PASSRSRRSTSWCSGSRRPSSRQCRPSAASSRCRRLPLTATAPAQFKITYTSADVDWELFHRQFDAALARVRGQLGRDYPLYIAGEAVRSAAESIVDRSPSDTAVVLGRFAAATHQEVDRAVRAARVAQAAWAHRGWRERGALVRRDAALIRQRKVGLAAVLRLGEGESRAGAGGEAEGWAEPLASYCRQLGGRER